MGTISQRPSSSLISTPIPGLNITSAIVIWLAITTIAPLFFIDSIPNALGLAILGFNNLNIIIALCEIVLGNHIKFIQNHYASLRKEYEEKKWKAAIAYLFMPLSLSTLFSGEKWAIMWSTYALWDPSYQNQESFGFFIDVGNGWSTIPPCLLWNATILMPETVHASWPYSWLLVGILGCASYWQVMYGTIIYFLSYFFNKRHIGCPFADIAFVAVANATWMVFPSFALYAVIVILRDQDITAVFR